MDDLNIVPRHRADVPLGPPVKPLPSLLELFGRCFVNMAVVAAGAAGAGLLISHFTDPSAAHAIAGTAAGFGALAALSKVLGDHGWRSGCGCLFPLFGFLPGAVLSLFLTLLLGYDDERPIPLPIAITGQALAAIFLITWFWHSRARKSASR